MKEAGIALWIAGVLLFLFAVFGLDTTVESGSGVFGSSRTHNIGLQQSQMIAVMAGLAMFLSGTIIHALAELLGPKQPVLGTTDGLTFDEQIGGQTPVAGLKVEKAVDQPDWEAEAENLGVIKIGEQYAFASHRYDFIGDAVRYARAHQHERQ